MVYYFFDFINSYINEQSCYSTLHLPYFPNQSQFLQNVEKQRIKSYQGESYVNPYMASPLLSTSPSCLPRQM